MVLQGVSSCCGHASAHVPRLQCARRGKNTDRVLQRRFHGLTHRAILFQRHPSLIPHMRLILASTSPRRKDLLALLGRPFEVCAPSFPEDVIVGIDTVIVLDEEVIGKPRDRADAEAMLRRLMGKEHRIWTAVAVVCERHGVRDIAADSVRVWMTRWDNERLAAYLRSGES